jgi:hypothetical protein
MSVFALDKDHPLTKAGMRVVHVVQKVELGLQPGYVVSSTPSVVLLTLVWRVDATE